MLALWPVAVHAQQYNQPAPNTPRTQSPNSGWARVIARSSGRIAADLYVDGKSVCRLPCQTYVPVGVHRFEGRGMEGSSVAQNVYLAPAATLPLFFDVVPSRATIRVITADPNTLIYVDGTFVGKGSWQASLAPGRHALLLRRSSGEALQQTLDMAAGMNYAIRDNPAPKPAVAAAPATTQPMPLAQPNPATGQLPARGAAPPAYNAPQPQSPAMGQYPQSNPYGTPTNYGAPGSTNPQARELGQSEIDPAFRGFSGAVFAPVILGGPSTNAYGEKCPATEFGGTCSTSGPRGGAIALQLGYSLGWITPEVMFGLSLDVSSANLQLPADVTQRFDTNGVFTQIVSDTKFMRLGILGGLGARLSTLAQGRRYTMSGVLGYTKRHVYIIPDSLFRTKPSYSAPTLFFDGGVVFGETPGVKVYAGLFLGLEITPTLSIHRDVTKIGLLSEQVPDSLETITPFRGTQLTFGPLIGVTFGH